MEDSIKFENYKKMIWDKAHKLSKQYHLEWSDIASQGYLIFTITLKKYDPSRASFSTYLYSRLKDLENYCKKQIRINYGIPIPEEDSYDKPEFWFANYNDFFYTLQKIDINKELSEDSKIILNYILDRRWEIAGKKPHRANFTIVANHFKELGWRTCKVIKAWKELKEWWDHSYSYF